MKTLVETVAIEAGGVLRLPPELLEQADLEVGCLLTVTVCGPGVLTICEEPGTDWLNTPEWEAKVREAQEDVAAGRTDFYASDEEFRAALVARMKTG